MAASRRIVFCRCPDASERRRDTAGDVLRALCESGESFETVSDLCKCAARGDANLRRLCETDDLRIAGCHPRAVRWLLAASGIETPPGRVAVADMANLSPAEAVDVLIGDVEPPGPALED